MIYTKFGNRSNLQCEERGGTPDTDFDFIATYPATRVAKTVPAKEVGEKHSHFFAGILTELDMKNRFICNDDSVVNRTLITLDYDDIPTDAETFKKAVHDALHPFAYYLYPTKSNTPENPCYRLIVKPERAYEEGYHIPLVRQLEESIGIKTGDSTGNNTWAHTNGLPVYIGMSKAEYLELCKWNDGEAYPITVAPEPIQPKTQRIMDANAGQAEPIPKELSYAVMENYIRKDVANLTTGDRGVRYGNFNSALMVIVKSVQTGEISIEDGESFAEMLACGNPEWIDDNVKKLHHNLKTNVRKEQTFMQKFDYKNEMIKEVRNMGADAREYMKSNVIAMKPAKEKKMDVFECADYLKSKYTFKMLGTGDKAQLAMYLPDEGIYSVERIAMERIIAKLGNYTERQRVEILKQIRITVDEAEPEKNPDLIPVANGIYNRQKHTLEPFSPEHVFTSKVTTKWVQNPEKPSWDVDEWLDTIANHDKDVVTLLWQVIAECLNGNYTRKRFFMIVGNGNNGKGTFQELLKNLIGENNVSALSMEQIGEKFSPAQLIGKTLNIGDDVESSTLPNVKNLLSITTGDAIMVEGKMKDGYSVALTTGMLFSANKVPKATNKTNGLYRRMCIIPFLANFNGKVEDVTIRDEKIKRDDVLEYVLHKALALDFEKFIEPAITLQYKLEYMKDNDTIFEFYSDEWATSPMSELDRIPTTYVYNQYEKFCIDGGNKPDTMRTFTTSMMQFAKDTHEKKSSRITNEFRDYMITTYGESAKWKMEPYEKPTQHFIKK